MAEIIDFKAGDFSFLVAPGGPFSAGVRANKGFALHRARFARPVPMMDGFARIKQHLEKLGRPVTALAACELRSPKPMSVQEFQAFNREYLKTLHAWGCRDGEINAPARSNIAPITEVPSGSSFFAFTYTVPEANAAGDFLISGLPEINAGATGSERTFGGRDVSLKGLAAKARFVMEGLRARVDALGCDWSGITGITGLHRARFPPGAGEPVRRARHQPDRRRLVSGLAAGQRHGVRGRRAPRAHGAGDLIRPTLQPAPVSGR